jgi:Protein of unknown function (DUF3157)
MRITILFLCFCFAWNTPAAQSATTEAGKRVILKDDGTWTYVPAESESKKKTSDATATCDIRRVNWGVGAKDVKQSEICKIIQDGSNTICFSTTISNLKADLIYIFIDDRLSRVQYVFTEKHFNQNLYHADFARISKLLEKKYGKPLEDRTIWLNDAFRNMPEEMGTAISIGHLYYGKQWETERTTIILMLYGDNHKINHVIEYSSKALQAMEKEHREKSELDDL